MATKHITDFPWAALASIVFALAIGVVPVAAMVVANERISAALNQVQQ